MHWNFGKAATYEKMLILKATDKSFACKPLSIDNIILLLKKTVYSMLQI